MNPKVFVSYASEDKDFAKAFADRLRSREIDAWFDDWEILPGDSLVDKIFEEGIKHADAFVAVLSIHSVNKPWVREELNAAIIRKINGASKLIPIVLDDCEVPEALQSTVHVRIKDQNNYDAELDRIVNAIYQRRDKPPLGTAPAYVSTIIDVIPDLTKVDCLVLKLSCEEADRRGHEMVTADTALEKARSLDISDTECFESLQILESRGYVSIRHVHDSQRLFAGLKVTPFGYEQYAKVYVDGYDSIIESVGLQILNLERRNSREISSALDKPIMLINHIIHSFERCGWVKLIKVSTGDHNLHIFNNISPELKRRFE